MSKYVRNDASAVNTVLFMSTDMILNSLYISFGYVVDGTRHIGVQFCMKSAPGFTNMLSNKRKTKRVLLINANSLSEPTSVTKGWKRNRKTTFAQPTLAHPVC